ncbi:MAG TPA: arginine repressor [Thermoanaerobaculia bacterium]|jgi:transcriptional regulator of arginine metabolism
MNIHAGARRRDEILRIIRETTVLSQDELLAALRTRGFEVTQPTLSRDLRELGVAKSPAGYIAPGELAAPVNFASFAARDVRESRLDQLIRDFVIMAATAGNLAVLKTPPAAAQPVASAADAADLEDAVGTIGGDDTIFIAFRTPAAADAFVRRVHAIAGQPARRRAR